MAWPKPQKSSSERLDFDHGRGAPSEHQDWAVVQLRPHLSFLGRGFPPSLTLPCLCSGCFLVCCLSDCCCLVAKLCGTLCDPVVCSLPSVHGISQVKNTGVGCRSLLQGFFLDQGSNPRLLHWQADSLPLSHLGYLHLMNKESSLQTCLGGRILCDTCEGSRFLPPVSPSLTHHHHVVPFSLGSASTAKGLGLGSTKSSLQILGGWGVTQTYSWFHLKRRLIIPGLL